jgi:hypothetical protein
MAYPFYAGSTFNYAGTLQLSGATPGGSSGVNSNQPDFSQWAVSAGLYDQAGENLIGAISVVNNSIPTLPSSNGLFLLNAPSTETVTWPIGKAQLIMQVITNTGTVINSDPVWMRIQANPIAGS